MLKKLLTSLVVTISLAMPLTALAANEITNGICSADPTHCSQTNNNLFGKGGTATQIADILIFLVGVIAVIMVVVGALRYVLSAGNPSAAAGAKDTILYALVGVALAILAYAIVSFVSSRFG